MQVVLGRRYVVGENRPSPSYLDVGPYARYFKTNMQQNAKHDDCSSFSFLFHNVGSNRTSNLMLCSTNSHRFQFIGVTLTSFSLCDSRGI
ncbi:hypothetical protein Y032_0057g2778 [Ancylostoma ceylanicum]|uniref:Uncharacterized protein n=1 Tax=Ancylostoma ceylanicum TaxID=53326 RepID=A0A016U5C5_9BILA|nr:hypothetical protein Y032_0057g2778 [Ancylostoma ceylanicum]